MEALHRVRGFSVDIPSGRSLLRPARCRRLNWQSHSKSTDSEAADSSSSADFSSQGTTGPEYSLPRSEEARRYYRTVSVSSASMHHSATMQEVLLTSSWGGRLPQQVYDFPQWERHRSQYRLIDRLLQIPQSHIMQNVRAGMFECIML